MTDLVLEIGKRYRIFYDDKGFKIVKKEGIIISKEENLIKLQSGEILNMQYILRAEEVQGR